VVEAVGRIVTQRGIEGIRLRQIAAEADLSLGAVKYHFPEHSDLLLAVHQDTVGRYVEGRNDAASSTDDPVERLVAVMRAGIPPWADDHVIRLLYEMHGLARRSEPHATLLGELWQREHALYVDIVDDGVAAGVFTPRESTADLATHLLALEDGLVLHLVGHNSAFDSQLVLEKLAGFAAMHLDCDDVATAVAPG
jgi:AcrR family transcriptional regulator